MAVSRHARRLAAKLRKARAETNAVNTAQVEARNDIVKRNMGRNPHRETSRGLVFDYSPTVKPVSYTRPLRWTKGAANVGC